MADNFTVQEDATGLEVATDEVTIDGKTVHVPRVKLGHGANGTYDGDVSSANPLPVSGPVTDAELRATPVPVSGTVTATGGLTDAELRASAVPITDSAAEFQRIKQKKFTDSEEVRYDIPATLASGAIYTGVAPDGTATSATSWAVIQTSFDANGNPNRERIRTAIAWDDRATGWS